MLLETGRRKSFSCTGRKFVELSPSVMQKAEFVDDEVGYLAKEISKTSIKGTAWFLLVAYSKMQEERENEGRIVKEKGTRNRGFGKLLPIQTAKILKLTDCS